MLILPFISTRRRNLHAFNQFWIQESSWGLESSFITSGCDMIIQEKSNWLYNFGKVHLQRKEQKWKTGNYSSLLEQAKNRIHPGLRNISHASGMENGFCVKKAEVQWKGLHNSLYLLAFVPLTGILEISWNII